MIDTVNFAHSSSDNRGSRNSCTTTPFFLCYWVIIYFLDNGRRDIDPLQISS